MAEKYMNYIAVNLVLTRINQGKREVLLQLRQNTGYMDNKYDTACSGHVEKGESFTKALVRECKEEIGIIVNELDLEFLTANHLYKEDYVQLFFTTDKYEGTPTICEPDECGDLRWFELDNLPENIIPYIKNVLDDIKYDIRFDDGDFIFLNNNKNNNEGDN